jgi:hypothetical protein
MTLGRSAVMRFDDLRAIRLSDMFIKEEETQLAPSRAVVLGIVSYQGKTNQV